ncbi:MAG: trypsin-like peptidase domain-containing protein, partial [Candidatus Aminicenantes bacterium]
MRKFLVFLMVVSLIMTFSTFLFSKIKVGEEVLERFETAHPYKGGGGVVLEKIYHWPEAGYISLHVANFELAPGDYMEISSPDGKYFYLYNGKGKVVRGGQAVISEFWVTHIPGDTAIVKLHSRNPKGGWGFVIDKWVHGFERGYIQAVLTEMEDAEIEAICNSDDKEWAKCYEGTTMYDKGRAVARLLMNGSSACTGWLVGSEGHLMTNYHCIGSQSTADNTDYEFMAEGATCTTNCAAWLACPGTVEATSGTVIKSDYDLDYTLILLPTNITGTYGYLQLRDTLPTIGERIYIVQHPGAWGKQLGVWSD